LAKHWAKRLAMRRRLRATLILLVLGLTAALVAAGCSSSGGGDGNAGNGSGGSGESSGAEGGSGGAELTVGWVFPGAAERDTIDAAQGGFGGSVASVVAEDAAGDPGAAAQNLVSQGATLVVSAVPGTCGAVPETHCVDPGGTGPTGANAVSLGGTFWNRAYLLGRAAGLLTESDTIAYLSPDESPRETATVDAFALGCQSANPNCIVRLVRAPANPPKALRALTKRGADVVATTLLDPALCKRAGAKMPVQPVVAPVDLCGNAYANPDLAAAVQPLIQDELDGDWQGGRSISLPLGAWADSVPADVKSKVEDRAKEIEGGRNVFVGPLFDNEGNQQLADGEELTPEFIASQWTWLLGGVLTD
jgi:basic membrane protein A